MLSPSAGDSDNSGDNFPVGTILAYKGAIADIPEKWALCNGSNGTPNLTGRFLEGVTSSPGSTKSAGLPNITGAFTTNSKYNDYSIFTSGSNGALSWSITSSKLTLTNNTGKSDGLDTLSFDASKSNSIYGASSTVQPASYTVLYIMKIKA